MAHTLFKFLVRMGLALVRVIVMLKAMLLAAFRTLGVIFRPLKKVFFSVFLVPAYQAAYSVRRRTGRWYRPAKNRIMFFLTNRYALHAVIFMIAVTTGIVNVQISNVRAETMDAFNKSLLYSIVTRQESPIIEEFADADPTTLVSSSYLDDSALGVPTASPTDTLALGSSSLAGGGSLAVPLMTSSSASVAPRESIEVYVVESGDTLSTIAAKFGLSINTILWANNLTLRSTIQPGDEMTILPVTGLVYTVKSGDTLTKIASTYSADQTTILAYNNLSDGAAIAVGDKLILPGAEMPAPTPAKRTSPVKTLFTTPSTTSTSSGATTSASVSSKMFWPSQGTYVVRGLSWIHNGYDIDCSGRADGTSDDDNLAAADGYVKYSGWKNGYGWVVEIDHGNGLMTRYGHNHKLYVTAGQTVTAGTPLARCGSTGNSTGTHLHFEVWANGKYKNPFDYLGR